MFQFCLWREEEIRWFQPSWWTHLNRSSPETKDSITVYRWREEPITTHGILLAKSTLPLWMSSWPNAPDCDCIFHNSLYRKILMTWWCGMLWESKLILLQFGVRRFGDAIGAYFSEHSIKVWKIISIGCIWLASGLLLHYGIVVLKATLVLFSRFDLIKAVGAAVVEAKFNRRSFHSSINLYYYQY